MIKLIEQDKLMYKDLPETPGVYLMHGVNNQILYVGKAGNLRRRVSSYFLRPRLRQGYGGQAHDSRIARLVAEIKKIDFRKTDTAIEALILESKLIKEYEPPYNVREKDGKSFLYVEITKDVFPRVLLARGKNEAMGERFGPFTSASSLREALKIVRKIFPWSTHPPLTLGKFKRACFDYEIGLCPGTCVGAVSRADYLKNIRNIKLLFHGKKGKILRGLKKEMKKLSDNLSFEKALKTRRQISALEHIQEVALITEGEVAGDEKQEVGYRIEGYDISNISGASAVGSMVVFVDGRSAKNEYRKFKIRTVRGINDVAMMKEVLRRRFRNSWALPNLILVDGGRPQVNVARAVLAELRLKIPVAGIAKGPTRKKNEFIGIVSRDVQAKTLIQVRDEAHRFAISYHRKVRSIKFKK